MSSESFDSFDSESATSEDKLSESSSDNSSSDVAPTATKAEESNSSSSSNDDDEEEEEEEEEYESSSSSSSSAPPVVVKKTKTTAKVVQPITTPTKPASDAVSSASVFSPRPAKAEEGSELFSPRVALTAVQDKDAVKARRKSVQLAVHQERGDAYKRQVLLLFLLALVCVALPTSVATFVLVGQFAPAVPEMCGTAVSDWAIVLAVINVVAILCFVPWLVKPGRGARFVALIALWLLSGTAIGIIIWGALIWVSGQPKAACVTALGGKSTGLGLMATILFAVSVALWLTTCLGLLSNGINAKLRSTEVHLGVTLPPEETAGETDKQRWERERDEKKAARAAKAARY